MNYLALKDEVSDFSLKNLSLDRKLSILRGFIPRNIRGVKFRPKDTLINSCAAILHRLYQRFLPKMLDINPLCLRFWASNRRQIRHNLACP
jgi:hypothetical protein